MGSHLFGSGCGFGGAFAYAKQAAAFAARIVYPNEALPSASFADPPLCRHSPEASHSVVQKRKLSHPSHQAAFRQAFLSPPICPCQMI